MTQVLRNHGITLDLLTYRSGTDASRLGELISINKPLFSQARTSIVFWKSL